MTREQAEADAREILASGTKGIPIEGSQWAMDWELTPEQKQKAGAKEKEARPLREDWKAKLDEADAHGSSSTST